MRRLLCIAAFALALCASAQEGGRTDGPEGSEVGKGGFDRPLIGKFSLALDWGASFNTAPLSGNAAPLYLGGTVSFWSTDWFLLDAHGSYAFNTGRTAVLVGPRFRTWTWPIAASLGLRAGVINDPYVGVRFGLSPIAALDMVFARHFIAGLEGCVDVPVAGNGSTVRVGLNVGWRF
jgi:hypothetical protein